MRYRWGRWGLVVLLLWACADSYAQVVVFAPLKVASYASSVTVTTLAGTAEKGQRSGGRFGRRRINAFDWRACLCQLLPNATGRVRRASQDESTRWHSRAFALSLVRNVLR